MYLLEETSEAVAMRQNVCNLLASHTTENALLALQLIAGGGVHTDFIPLLCVYALEERWGETAPKGFLRLLKQVFLPKEMANFKRLADRSQYEWYDFAPRLLEQIEKKNKGITFLLPYWKEILRWGFIWSEHRCDALGVICFQHKLLSDKEIFDTYIRNSWYKNELSLSEHNLQDLPDSLAEVTVENLNITYNPFKHTKRKKWVNTGIKCVYYNEDITDSFKKILGQCFPNIWKKMFTKEKHLICVPFLKCVPKYERDIKFYKHCAETYKREGNYRMALKIYNYLHQNYPFQEEVFMLKIAGIYALMQDTKNMLRCLEAHLKDSPYNTAEEFFSNTDFSAYQQNQALLDILAV